MYLGDVLESASRHGGLFDDASSMQPLPALFWSFLVGEADPRGGLKTLPDVHLLKLEGLSSPTAYVATSASAPGVAVVAVRGTQDRRDLKVNARPLIQDVNFERRIGRIVESIGDHPLANVVSSISKTLIRGSGEWRIHRGMLVGGARLAAAVVAALPPGTTAVRFYGHSLGAACASIAYRLVREACPEWRCSAAVTSCPNFCNEPCREGWLARDGADSDATYRHYYARGDPIVALSSTLTGTTRRLSIVEYACPRPETCGAAKLIVPMLAHVMYQPSKFAESAHPGFRRSTSSSSSSNPQRSRRASASASTFVDPGWGGVRSADSTFVNPKYSKLAARLCFGPRKPSASKTINRRPSTKSRTSRKPSATLRA